MLAWTCVTGEIAHKGYVEAIAASVAAAGWGDLWNQVQSFWYLTVFEIQKYVKIGPRFKNNKITL